MQLVNDLATHAIVYNNYSICMMKLYIVHNLDATYCKKNNIFIEICQVFVFCVNVRLLFYIFLMLSVKELIIAFILVTVVTICDIIH